MQNVSQTSVWHFWVPCRVVWITIIWPPLFGRLWHFVTQKSGYDRWRGEGSVRHRIFFFVRPPPPTILVEFFPHKTYMLQIDFYCATNFPNKSKPVVPQESRPYCNNGFYWLRQVLSVLGIYTERSFHLRSIFIILYYVCVCVCVYMIVCASTRARARVFIFL